MNEEGKEGREGEGRGKKREGNIQIADRFVNFVVFRDICHHSANEGAAHDVRAPRAVENTRVKNFAAKNIFDQNLNLAPTFKKLYVNFNFFFFFR